MFGSAIDASRRSFQFGAMVSSAAASSASVTSPEATATLRPFAVRNNSGRSAATKSITFCFFASSAERLSASRTARSAHSALRPRSCARLRMYAEASWTDFRSIALPDGAPFLSFPDLSSPGLAPPMPMATGVAAPRFVPGAIAATWAE